MAHQHGSDLRVRAARQIALYPTLGALLLTASPAHAVVGGTPVDLVARPELRALVRVNNGCGGTLIDPSWVVTAAHCVIDLRNPNGVQTPGTVRIEVGSTTLNAGVVKPVDFVIKHHDFSGTGFIPWLTGITALSDETVDFSTAKDDIALIRLSTPVTAAEATPMPMQFTRPLPLRRLWFAGWGATRLDYTFPLNVRPVDFPLDAQEDSGLVQEFPINWNPSCGLADLNGLICASGNGAACAGDSGGPMVVNGNLVGVFSIADCISATAGVPLARHQDWIENIMASVPAGQPVPTCNGLHPTIVGSMAADTLRGTGRADIIVGLAGNDDIDGNGGDDLICGMNGNDDIDGDGGNDTIFGGGGADRLRGSGGDDLIFGRSGNDDIDGGDGQDELWGEDGADTIRGGSNNDEIHGGNHNDTLLGEWGRDEIFGDAGADTIRGGRDADTIFGGTGDDDIEGNEHGDFVQGDDGDDNIDGNGGADELRGGGGNDVINGGTGGDTIIGGPGFDTANGNGGNDACVAERRTSC